MSDKFLGDVQKLAQSMEAGCIRVDVDDRALTLQKRIREAEMEWVPYIIVVGQRETESGTLAVRDRKTGKIRSMKLEGLIDEIAAEIRNKPYKPLALPRLLSKRPQFYG
jgi:threonyl-tRNA synthetase